MVIRDGEKAAVAWRLQSTSAATGFGVTGGEVGTRVVAAAEGLGLVGTGAGGVLAELAVLAVSVGAAAELGAAAPSGRRNHAPTRTISATTIPIPTFRTAPR
jgi:hypothetical protein